MRVVLDTNIFVSSLLGGRLGVIVDEWKAQRFTLIVSVAIAQEYLGVVNRSKFKIPAQKIASITDYLIKTAEFVTPLTPVTAIKSDPSDNIFLEAALEGKADCVVSGDAHLLDMKTFGGIPILTAREFIERL